MAAFLVYMTAASTEEAQTIGRVLVEERLAACVNILGAAQSIYRWKDGVETAAEVAFIAKTRADRFEALTKRVKELHSYDTPCIVALPVVSGNPGFLEWIAASAAPPPPAS